jgi:hypothetical protein
MAAGRERVEEIGGTPHDKRPGMLKNASPSGDFSKAARCGAKTMRGTRCQCPAMKTDGVGFMVFRATRLTGGAIGHKKSSATFWGSSTKPRSIPLAKRQAKQPARWIKWIKAVCCQFCYPSPIIVR